MENVHDVYRTKDCMKTFCEHAMEIINFKKMMLLPNEQHKSDKNCCICKEKINMLKIKISHVIIEGNIDLLCVVYAI